MSNLLDLTGIYGGLFGRRAQRHYKAQLFESLLGTSGTKMGQKLIFKGKQKRISLGWTLEVTIGGYSLRDMLFRKSVNPQFNFHLMVTHSWRSLYLNCPGMYTEWTWFPMGSASRQVKIKATILPTERNRKLIVKNSNATLILRDWCATTLWCLLLLPCNQANIKE